MKDIILTFDDGRIDNYTVAYPIMKKYGVKATIYITTGFVDGTWKEYDWSSARGAMSGENVKEMYDDGFEIALHGDKHITDIDDFSVALKKIEKITGDVCPIGFSLPNSEASADEVEALKNAYKEKLTYVRGGRRCNTGSMINRILYILYTVTKSNLAFKLFNKKNIISQDEKKNIFNKQIPTVVVKKGDTAEQLISLFNSMKDNSACVLMLHSILDKNDEYYGKDSWCWDVESFEKLISFLSSSENFNVKCLKTLWEESHE